MVIFTLMHTVISRTILVLISVVAIIPLSVFMFASKKKYEYKRSKLVFWIAHWFYWAILKCSLVPISYKGKENIPNNSAIFVSNHQSSLDIPLLGVLVGGHQHVWLAKHELMKTWFLRWVMPFFTVTVDVSSPRTAMASLLKLVNRLKGKESNLMIFPEGGRYTDGKIHPFFKGFSLIAKKTERPVIPVFIKGVSKVYPPDSFMIYWYPIEVIIGKPFKYQESDTDESFKERVYEWFVQEASRQ